MRLFEGLLDISYGQFWVESDADAESILDLEASFRDQTNGLCGAGVVGVLWCFTGVRWGAVAVTIDLLQQAPLDVDGWEEVVAVSFQPTTSQLRLVNTGGPVTSFEIPVGSYRVLFCARSMDEGAAEETLEPGSPPVDSYKFILWPADPGADIVVKVTSQTAAEYHQSRVCHEQVGGRVSEAEPGVSGLDYANVHPSTHDPVSTEASIYSTTLLPLAGPPLPTKELLTVPDVVRAAGYRVSAWSRYGPTGPYHVTFDIEPFSTPGSRTAVTVSATPVGDGGLASLKGELVQVGPYWCELESASGARILKFGAGGWLISVDGARLPLVRQVVASIELGDQVLPVGGRLGATPAGSSLRYATWEVEEGGLWGEHVSTYSFVDADGRFLSLMVGPEGGDPVAALLTAMSPGSTPLSKDRIVAGDAGDTEFIYYPPAEIFCKSRGWPVRVIFAEFEQLSTACSLALAVF